MIGTAHADWPSMFGPNHNFSSEKSSITLVEGFQNARLGWVSEASDLGNGKYPTAFPGPCVNSGIYAGGAASPIVYDGKIFVNYFIPSGDVYASRYLSEYEKSLCFAIEADDVMIAVDAATGKTVWKKQMPQSGLNIPMDKRAGWGPTPVALDGRAFKISTMGLVLAYDADDGTELWRNDVGEQHDRLVSIKQELLEEAENYYAGDEGYNPGLIVAEGILVTGDFSEGLIGFDPQTGKKLWVHKNVRLRMNTPSVFTFNGRDYVIIADPGRNRMILVDPINGEILWERTNIQHSGPIVCSGEHAFVVEGEAESWSGRWTAYRITPAGAEHVWTLSDEYSEVVTKPDKGPRPHVTYHDGFVYIVHFVGGGTDPQLLAVEEETGQVAATHRGNQVEGNSMPFVFEDRVCVVRDMWHQNPTWTMFEKATLTPIGETWGGAFQGITGYEVPSVIPYSDGFLYARTALGTLAAYDLRRSADIPTVTLTHPSSDTTISNTAVETLKATASHAGGIAKVSFYVNGAKVGEDDSAPYETIWDNKTPGDYFVYAVAYAANGYKSSSSSIPVSVIADACTGAPGQVTATNPSNGATLTNTRMPTLRWSWTGDFENIPTGYKVYLGDNADDLEKVAELSNVGDSTFVVEETLEMEKTYFWRVDAVNSCGITQGQVQSFTIEKPQGFRYLRVHFFKEGGMEFRIFSVEWLGDGGNIVPTLTSNIEQGVALDANVDEASAFHIYDGNADTEWGNSETARNTIDFGPSTVVTPDQVKVSFNRDADSIRFEGSYFGNEWYRIGIIGDTHEYGGSFTIDLGEPVRIESAPVTAIPTPTLPEKRPTVRLTGHSIHIETPDNSAEFTVTLLDVSGRTVAVRRVTQGRLELRNLLPSGGMYLMQITARGTGKVYRKRFCVFR